MSKDFLAPKEPLRKMLGGDFFLWEYYGEGILGRIQDWIFRSRIKVLMKSLRDIRLKPKMILDVGCGPMFISYALIRNETIEYVGVDIMPTDRLKKYRDAMRSFGMETIEVVRASAESLPFRRDVFDFSLSLDVLEHLSKPRKASAEIYRVVRDDGAIAVSLPLENLFQRLSRIGFVLMKIAGNPFLKKKWVPVTKTPQYHYVGDVESYDDMVNLLKENFNLILTKYTPLGIHRSININAVHILKKI